VSAAVVAGNGPDVVQLFYGWLDGFVAGKLIQPLPADQFPSAKIEEDFFPIVSAMKRGDAYYGLPTAVRSLALFYNKKLMAEAGLDPAKPPQTLEEFVAVAEKTTKRDGAGNLTSEGFALDMAGQDHQWWREVLVRQFGGAPYQPGDRKVAYDSEAGEKALAFYTDLQTQLKVGQQGFMDDGQAAFKADGGGAQDRRSMPDGRSGDHHVRLPDRSGDDGGSSGIFPTAGEFLRLHHHHRAGGQPGAPGRPLLPPGA
jgi:multiple sugar transport system substrate-binding protein